MGDLIVALIPLAAGIVLSPLAIMALVAVLLSQSARTNGVAYLAGWTVAVGGSLAVGLWLFTELEVHEPGDLPDWVAVVRFVLGTFLVIIGVWVYRRGQPHMDRMAAASTPTEIADAAPHLPGWLQTVQHFRPGRSALLGFGIFILNPIDLSCAVLAGLDIVLADLGQSSTIAITIGFAVVAILPIAVPVVLVLAAGHRAQPTLDATRNWIASHTGALNAAFLLVIGAMQIQKAISA